jgi:hypothetical protein
MEEKEIELAQQQSESEQALEQRKMEIQKSMKLLSIGLKMRYKVANTIGKKDWRILKDNMTWLILMHRVTN